MKQVLFITATLLIASFTAWAQKTPLDLRPEPESTFQENRMSASVFAGPLFDVGGNTSEHLLSATLVSWHWQLDDVSNPGWRRGNTEWITTAYFHPVWDGTESRFLGALFGPRYNFVQEGWKWIPFIGARVGFGFTDSRDNSQRIGAQGQDFVFTFMVEAGTRYIINDRIDLSLGAHYQHFSNAGLSEPAQKNYGLDVLGPVASLNVRF